MILTRDDVDEESWSGSLNENDNNQHPMLSCLCPVMLVIVRPLMAAIPRPQTANRAYFAQQIVRPWNFLSNDWRRSARWEAADEISEDKTVLRSHRFRPRASCLWKEK